LVAFRRKRNLYALRAFLLLFAIEKEAEFEAGLINCLSNLLKMNSKKISQLFKTERFFI